MKLLTRLLPAALCLCCLFGLLAGCADAGAPGASGVARPESQPNKAQPESQAQAGEAGQDEPAALLEAVRGRLITEPVEAMEGLPYTIYELEGLTVLTRGSYVNRAVYVYENATGAVYDFFCPFMELQDIQLGQEPNTLQLVVDGRVFGFDKIFHNFEGSYLVDYTTGQVRMSDLVGINPDGLFGMERGGDSYDFGACAVEGDTASFRFVHTGSANGGGGVGEVDIGPEIYITTPPVLEDRLGRRSARIRFSDTALTLPEDFITALNALPQVESAQLRYDEDAWFAGTSLELVYAQDVYLQYYMNQSGAVDTFEDFNIRFVPADAA